MPSALELLEDIRGQMLKSLGAVTVSPTNRNGDNTTWAGREILVVFEVQTPNKLGPLLFKRFFCASDKTGFSG